MPSKKSVSPCGQLFVQATDSLPVAQLIVLETPTPVKNDPVATTSPVGFFQVYLPDSQALLRYTPHVSTVKQTVPSGAVTERIVAAPLSSQYGTFVVTTARAPEEKQ